MIKITSQSIICFKVLLIQICLLSTISCQKKESEEYDGKEFSYYIPEGGMKSNSDLDRIHLDISKYPLKDSILFMGFKIGMTKKQVNKYIDSLVIVEKIERTTEQDLLDNPKIAYLTKLIIPQKISNNVTYIYDTKIHLLNDTTSNAKLIGIQLNMLLPDLPEIPRLKDSEINYDSTLISDISSKQYWKQHWENRLKKAKRDIELENSQLCIDYQNAKAKALESLYSFFSIKYGNAHNNDLYDPQSTYWFVPKKQITAYKLSNDFPRECLDYMYNRDKNFVVIRYEYINLTPEDLARRNETQAKMDNEYKLRLQKEKR